MTAEEDSERKCFTFIWKLENANYCWQANKEFIASPSFTVEELHETIWNLKLFPSIRRHCIAFYLHRQAFNMVGKDMTINSEVACLSSDNTVLHAVERKNVIIENCKNIKFLFISPEEMFLKRRSEFLPQDTLTVRCRIWKSVGEMSKDVQCFALSRIDVEKRSFLWNIEKFSAFDLNKIETYNVKSPDNANTLLTINVFLSGGLDRNEKPRFFFHPRYPKIKACLFQMSIVDAFKNTVRCFQDEFFHHDSPAKKQFTLFYTKKELLKMKSLYLPNDVFSLQCECEFVYGIVLGTTEMVDSNTSTISKIILIYDLKSMLNDSCVSDVNLKTKNQTYPAHKFILSARSPVFKSMFENDMKEKIDCSVSIEDLNDSTFLRMLRYIYCAEVDELEWASAIELYEAADKYQIPSLKKICSSHLKDNLCVKTACELLVLANRYQDEDLEGYVQDYILWHGKYIVDSEEWEQLMETNLKLAAETLRLKFIE